MLKLEDLKSKQENGITLYFYAGLGWVTEERLNQPDVAKNEAVKDFDCNPRTVTVVLTARTTEIFRIGKIDCRVVSTTAGLT